MSEIQSSIINYQKLFLLIIYPFSNSKMAATINRCILITILSTLFLFNATAAKIRGYNHPDSAGPELTKAVEPQTNTLSAAVGTLHDRKLAGPSVIIFKPAILSPTVRTTKPPTKKPVTKSPTKVPTKPPVAKSPTKVPTKRPTIKNQKTQAPSYGNLFLPSVFPPLPLPAPGTTGSPLPIPKR